MVALQVPHWRKGKTAIARRLPRHPFGRAEEYGHDTDALHGPSMMPLLDHTVTSDNRRDGAVIAAPGLRLLPFLWPSRIGRVAR